MKGIDTPIRYHSTISARGDKKINDLKNKKKFFFQSSSHVLLCIFIVWPKWKCDDQLQLLMRVRGEKKLCHTAACRCSAASSIKSENENEKERGWRRSKMDSEKGEEETSFFLLVCCNSFCRKKMKKFCDGVSCTRWAEGFFKVLMGRRKVEVSKRREGNETCLI